MKTLKCTCEHTYQDELYGQGMRAMNPKDGKEGVYTCTVCGKEHSSSKSKK